MLASAPRSANTNREQQAPLDVWGPVWSSGAFLLVTLVAGCLYISRRDF